MELLKSLMNFLQLQSDYKVIDSQSKFSQLISSISLLIISVKKFELSVSQ